MSHNQKLDFFKDNSSTDYMKYDNATFEALFKKHFKPLCAYCQYKFGFDLDLAKDAVHNGFIKLWESRHTLCEELSIQAYLYKVITNVCLDILKHEKVKIKHEKHVHQNTSADTFSQGLHNVDFEHLKNEVDKAVAELPEQMRKVFELCKYEGMKYAEVAHHLNISVKTVETQMSRSLIRLRQKLSHYLTLYFITFLIYLIF